MKFTLFFISALVGSGLAYPIPDADASKRDLQVSFVF